MVPERHISSLGAMGWGLDTARKFFRRRRHRRRRRQSQNAGFGKNGFARFVTHSRATDALVPPFCREFRHGSFLCSRIRGIASENRGIPSEIRWNFLRISLELYIIVALTYG